jgi:hypothetical protein
MLSQTPLGTLQGILYPIVIGVVVLVFPAFTYSSLEVFSACGL